MRRRGVRFRPLVTARCRPAAWVALLSLFALAFNASLHGAALSERQPAGLAAAAGPSFAPEPAAAQGDHDPDLCPACRLGAQVRLGLRAPGHALARVALCDSLAPQRSAEAQPLPPGLRALAPRAPPSALRSLDA